MSAGDAQLDWPDCEEVEDCRGRQVDAQKRCLLHTTPDERKAIFTRLSAGAPVEVTAGVQFTEELLIDLLGALPRNEHGGPVLQDADFREARFQFNADFDRATFQGMAQFSDATFEAWVGFREATFQDAALFGGASFQGSAPFDFASFQDLALFSGASFQRLVSFHYANFQDEAMFSGTSFEGDTLFFRDTLSRQDRLRHGELPARRLVPRGDFQGRHRIRRGTL